MLVNSFQHIVTDTQAENQLLCLITELPGSMLRDTSKGDLAHLCIGRCGEYVLDNLDEPRRVTIQSNEDKEFCFCELLQC